MAKQINLEPGRTYSEFVLLPGYTPARCTLQTVSLSTNLAGVKLKVPLLSAAMTSVTGYEMALALGKEGGLGVLPARLTLEDQVAIIKKLKQYELSFVKDPVKVQENATIEEVLLHIERFGHTKVPIVDRNNVFLGMFEQEEYWKSSAHSGDLVANIMLNRESLGKKCKNIPDLTVEHAKEIMTQEKLTYLVLIDEQNRLVKLAFQRDVEKMKVAAAISTHEGWKERAQETIAAGVDMILIDTSDSYTEFAEKVLTDYKTLNTYIPLCAGNVVTYEGALFLMNAGADIVKVGMSSGSICTTAREKAVGRAPMTALIDCERARKTFFDRTNKYIPLIMDGGITSSADMVISLSISDAIMGGGYFNKFYEAAGPKLDENKRPTSDETRVRFVETWGEGSERAMNLARYGHTKRTTFFPEGVEGIVECAGRLKPNVRQDIIKVKAALVNAGCTDLAEFRKNAVLELISSAGAQITKDTHSIHQKK